MTETSFVQTLQAATPPGNAPDTHVNALSKRLQPYFPESDVDDLLNRSGLVTKGGALDPLLVHKGFVKTTDRFPGSNALILDVTITEPGVQAIRTILQGYLVNNDNKN